jgi:P-type E1-E2 ATPase
LDINGTLALDGRLLPGVASRITALCERLHIFLLTADTHGTAESIAQQLGIDCRRLEPGQEAEQKCAVVDELGARGVVAIGNGANDSLMLAAAGLGSVIMGPEGVSTRALAAADIVVTDITAALDLLLFSQRLLATLRR